MRWIDERKYFWMKFGFSSLSVSQIQIELDYVKKNRFIKLKAGRTN